ncbi:MAG: SGNH/GDSL hydrolase family protein [Elusimicrobia bacterium]|nr:SGNH/GDSL hydrolase family protein [Elusimicrobiota bacterium]
MATLPARFKALAPKAGLSLAALLLLYAAVEFALFPAAVAFLPHGLAWRLDAPVQVLCQSTKRGLRPRDYVLILGDSYAVGLGDEARNASRWTRAAFGSQAHLRALTGRDVVSMGYGGAGSMGGLAAEPAGTFAFLGRTLFYRLAEPGVVLAYFYEGNELDDNITDLRESYDPRYDQGRLYDPSYFRRFMLAEFVERHDGSRAALRGGFGRNLVFWRFGMTLLRSAWRRLPGAADGRTSEAAEVPAAEPVNRVLLGQTESFLPEASQGPSLELTDDELRRGVWVLEQSLGFLRSRFPGARVLAVYIPSPLSCYELASPEVSVETYHDRASRYPAAAVRRRSDLIAARAREAALRAGCGFVDARPSLRAEARRRFIHGVYDAPHLNAAGYRALAEAIAPAL